MVHVPTVAQQLLRPLIYSVLACCCVPLWGTGEAPSREDTLKGLSLEELGNVEVTTISKEPEEIWHTPAAVYVLTSEDIRRSGASSIPEILRLVPGVQVSRIQSDNWAVGIRGFAGGFSKGLLVMIDGRSVYTPLFEGVYWDVQDLALEDIDRIEVTRGPGGTVWGENAVNGVINIVTKRAGETPKSFASLQGGGEITHFIGVAQVGWSPRANLQTRVYAKAFDRGPELNSHHQAFDHWSQQRGGFRTDWQPSTSDKVMAEGNIYQGRNGFLDVIGLFTPPSNLVAAHFYDISGGDVTLRWDHRLSEQTDFYVQAYFDRTSRKSPEFGETRNVFDLNFVGHMGFLPRQNIVFGGEWQESPDNFIQRQATVNFTPHQLRQYIHSAFMQDSIAIVPHHLSLLLGSKIEDNNYSGAGVEPSIRFLWNPTTHQALWAAASRALRVPGRVDRDLSFTVNTSTAPPIFESIQGNPNFKPEVLIAWECGYKALVTQKIYFITSLFHNQYDNLESYTDNFVVTHPTVPYPYTLNTLSWANGVKGVTHGLEMAPSYKPFSWLDIHGTWSHLEMELHSKTGFHQASYAARYAQSSPRNMATLRLLFTLPHGIEIDPTFRYMSALPYQKVPAYTTADAHLAWKFTHQTELFVNGRNLLEPSHTEFSGNNDVQNLGIRRSIYGGIRWSH